MSQDDVSSCVTDPSLGAALRCLFCRPQCQHVRCLLPLMFPAARMRAPCRYAPKARYLPRLRDLFLANFPGEGLQEGGALADTTLTAQLCHLLQHKVHTCALAF